MEPMRKYRNLLILVLLLLIAGAGLLFFLKWNRPPRAARILPEGDRFLYVDLRPLHLWNWKDAKSLQIEGDYQRFVDQTGIRFERDLDQAAICWRDSETGGNTDSAAVFIGQFDRAKLQRYLEGLSSRTDSYRTRTLYSIPHENHMVHVALLDPSTVAVTNMAQEEAINGMIDRWDGSSTTPVLLAQYYGNVPAGSLAWLIDHFPAQPDPNQLPDGLSFSFLENTVAVISARYNGSLLLHADVLAASESDAHHLIDQATSFLSLYRSISSSLTKGGDRDVKAALASIRVEQKGNVAAFSATLSQNFLKKMVQEAEPQVVPATPAPSATPELKKNRREQRPTSPH